MSTRVLERRLPTVLAVDAYDINRYPDEELPDVIAQATRFFVAVQAPVRVITQADPYSLRAVIERTEQRMLQVARPLRAPLDAKRIYLDWAQQHLVLRDLRYYILVWTDGLEAGTLKRVASENFQTPVTPVTDFSGGFQPRAFVGTYREGGLWGDYLAPVGDPPHRPFLRLLVGYTLRGEWSPWTLHPLLNLGSPFALAQDIYTYPPDKEQIALANAAGALSAQMQVNAKSGTAPDTRSGRAADDCQRVLQETQAGQRLHKLGHVLLLKAETLKDLDEVTQTALTLMGPSLPFRLERGEQRNLLRMFGPESSGAIGGDVVPKWPIISQGLAVEMPFGRRTRTDTDGILLGIDEDGRYPIFYQGWQEAGSGDPRARHMIVCGATGSGKTFFGNKMCLEEAATNNAQVVVIEPQGHGQKLVLAAGGPGMGIYHPINFETTRLNVLDVVHTNLTRQIAHVKSLLEVLIRATVEEDAGARQRRRVFNDEEVGALDQALQEVYGNQPILPFLTAAETPLLRHLCDKLQHIKGGTRLARRIRALLVDGSPGPVFDRPTNLPLGLDEAQVIAFNVAEVEERYRPFVYGVFMGAARRRTRRKPRDQRLLFWADEFGWLCQVPALAQAVAYEVKTVRTFNTAWVMGEQNAFLFSRNAAGRFILENTADQVYFRQTGTALETVARFNKEFTARHLSILRGAPLGLCVAKLGREIYTVRVEANDFEYQVFGGT